ncbi:MAG: hypothetical protein KDC54_25235 [Lewinella sp.]|nr:hypothetical protein [Lewinella sp.]
MARPKLFDLLATCRQSELPELMAFVRSPFWNTAPEQVALFELLLPHWPAFTGPSLNKAALYQTIYPGQTYHDKTLRYLFSQASRLVEGFLRQVHYQKDSARQRLDLLRILSERGLEKAYRHHQRRYEEEQPAEADWGVTDYLQAYRRAEVEEQHFGRQRLRQFDTRLEEAALALDRYYYLQRLIYACGMLDRETIFQGKYTAHLPESWLAHLAQSPHRHDPLIALYYRMLMMLRHEEDTHYFELLRDQLLEEKGLGDSESQRNVYLGAINYCLRKIRQGPSSFVAEALALYQLGIERGILLEKGELSPWTFTNVVKLALRLHQYEWIEDFMARFSGHLPAAFRNNALHYNRAELFYYTRRYDEAQAALNQVVYSDLNYYLGARVMLAKIYYEEREEEVLLSHLAAFSIFLKRNKEISADLKHTYLNFCDMLYQLLRDRPKVLNTLEERIRQTHLLTDRQWLLEQLAQKISPSGSV